MNVWLWGIPLISAIMCWMIALGTRTVLLNRLPALCRKLAENTAEAFLTKEVIRSGISQAGSYETLRPFIEEHTDTFLRQRLVKSMPVIGMLIGDKTILQLKTLFMKELETLFPVVVDKYLETLSGADTANLVSRQIATVTAAEWKNIFRAAAGKELRVFPLAGLVCGLITGLVQLLYMTLIIQ